MQELVNLYRDLFRNRETAFAQGVPIPGRPDKFMYPPLRDSEQNDIALTDEHIVRHLRGEIQLGVYPLMAGDVVMWAAMDFDGDDEGETALDQALKQSARFSDEGLASYVEVSRSGKGAHVWLFFDEPLPAKTVRAVIHRYLLKSDTYDRMFPNQDSAGSGYGNLIALPYNGAGYPENKSVFIDPVSREKVNPRDFLANVVRNRRSWVEKLYDSFRYEVQKTATTVSERAPSQGKLTGAVKVVTFCNWMKAARERMPQQNQEPEFYALCCQFAQLAQGERLAYEFGRLHPYSDERIASKFAQAVRVNRPHPSKVLREEYGYECTCDLDYGVDYCYELANKSFSELMASRKGEMRSWKELGPEILDRTKERYRLGGNLGYAYGYDRLDDMTALREGELIVIGARTGIGKAQPLDAQILTPDGFVPMGDIKVGDLVMARTGEPTEVTGVYPQGVEAVYEIELVDGRKTRASGEHLWLVSEPRGTPTVMTTMQLLRKIHPQNSSEPAVYRIPRADNIQMNRITRGFRRRHAEHLYTGADIHGNPLPEYPDYNTIARIHYVGHEETQCIRVAHPEHLYITDDFIVTHNTSFALDITANLTEGGIPCYWQSMEMTSEQLGVKYLGRRADVDSRAIMEANLDKEDWKKILSFQKDHPNTPLFVDDETKDIDRMLDTLSEMIYEHGPGVVFLDYMEMFRQLPGESMTQLTARISLEAKGLAKVLRVPVVLLSNFNRKAEEEQLEGSVPADGWLRNSGLLEQTADVILYLLGNKGKGVLKRIVHIQKERFTGMAHEQCVLWFDQAKSRFLTTRPNESEDGKIVIHMQKDNLDFL